MTTREFLRWLYTLRMERLKLAKVQREIEQKASAPPPPVSDDSTT